MTPLFRQVSGPPSPLLDRFFESAQATLGKSFQPHIAVARNGLMHRDREGILAQQGRAESQQKATVFLIGKRRLRIVTRFGACLRHALTQSLR